MMKSTITNDVYRNILIVFIALSILSQTVAIFNGDISFFPAVSLITNIIVLILFSKHDEYLKLTVQIAAALALVNSFIALFIQGAFVALLNDGSYFWLILSIVLHFGPGLYLLIGCRKHIQIYSIDEGIPEPDHHVNSNLSGIRNRTTLNFLLIPASIILTIWPMTHYSDGGCDGGLCGLYLFMHGAPLALACVLTIIAINKALAQKGSCIVFAILAFFVNLAILLPDYGYRMDALKYPGYIVVGAIILTFVLYANADNLATVSETEEPDANSDGSPLIGWRERDEDKLND